MPLFLPDERVILLIVMNRYKPDDNRCINYTEKQ